MSKAMIQSFFPSCYEWVQQRSNTYYLLPIKYILDDILFPDKIANICPEIQIQLVSTTSTTTIRLPFLGLSAILGIIIGFYCGFYYYRCYNKNKNYYYYYYSNFYLFLSFVTFGIMNISGLFIHSLWDAPTPTTTTSSSSSYPELYPLLWICDTYMTGVSSICLLFASLEYIIIIILVKYSTKQLQQQQQQQNQQRKKIFIGWIICQLVGIGCIVWYFFREQQTTTSRSSTISSSHPLELWYLLPIILTGIPISIAVFGETIINSISKNNNSNSNNSFLRVLLSLHQTIIIRDIFQSLSIGQWLLIIGAIVAILGVLLDRYFCLLLHDNFGIIQDLFSASTLLFLGCDIMFVGIYLSFPLFPTKNKNINNNKEKKS